MRPDKFTVKMQEALQGALDSASKLGQQEVSNDHLLISLLEQGEGLVRPLLDKIEIDVAALVLQIESRIASQARVHGGSQPFVGNELRKTIDRAEEEQGKLKDEFLSTE
jgi:ATP-dependent Clp protease ATP-binding subunit ClpB